jgi:nitroreductase
MMGIRDVMLGRRSIRKYKSDSVTEEDIYAIIEAGTYAPSAVNLQPWHYVAVEKKEDIEDLVRIMDKAADIIAPAVNEQFQKNPEIARDTLRFIGMLGGAPLVVLSFQYLPKYNVGESSIIQSIAAGTQNMILRAWSLGIASCWMTAPIDAGVDAELRDRFAPGKGDLVNMVTFGYPEFIPNAPPRKDGRINILNRIHG